ncbi:S-layer homology domain-containing protein [Brevibacillus ruminantium]|uniref:S-layer homology domain-containing protein n=1 Tax=Brevibacillus ruminantium TaxID=2950604 RepID=A0ABY4WIL0_9BACL|nr:S-layer homology domain-containing protein [Brevibacillus ruminantium]USG66714.1 S-layer homology domain-containing protein [Brevibacillus ruminantium]
MAKRYFLYLAMVAFWVQSFFTAQVGAAFFYDDINGHWAEKEIRFLAERGIYKSGGNPYFNPDKTISRGEAMVLVNRVLEDVYGNLAEPGKKSYIDHRYPLKAEVESLVANMQALLDVNTGFVNSFRPGDQMLYNLHLASNGFLMKKPQKDNPDWWLSTSYLQYPISREEASMILFYVMSPYKLRVVEPKVEDVQIFYDGYHQWKQKSFYVDTASPYAEGIREFRLFGDQRNFDPYANMTRGQLAVVLARLHQYLQADAGKQFGDSPKRQQLAASLYLTAANQALSSKNQKRLSTYVSEAALAALKQGDIQLPLHQFPSVLQIRKDESATEKMWVIGQYEQRQIGPYELEFLFEKDESNPFGKKITNITFRER